jgi:hypothetical protein
MRPTILFLLSACAAAAGCSIDRPCDTDQTFLPIGVCVDNAWLATSPDGGEGQGGGAGGAGACAANGRFGAACSDDEICVCDTNVCAFRSESMDGLCTHTGCVEHPEICPDGWLCQDLGSYAPGLPSICVPDT